MDGRRPWPSQAGRQIRTAVVFTPGVSDSIALSITIGIYVGCSSTDLADIAWR
jgi:hypothetical protein